jgi:lysyl-tRNA synthetase class II
MSRPEGVRKFTASSAMVIACLACELPEADLSQPTFIAIYSREITPAAKILTHPVIILTQEWRTLVN